jgi:hypothetical protein
MKKCLLILIIFFSAAIFNKAAAQCSVCTRTAQQLGEKPAKALNAGIIYLMLTPFLIAGYIGYRWWKDNRE